MAMSRRAKALQISKKVKDAVYERDGGCCVYCGAQGLPEAHFTPRSHGGLGIEENILTLCRTHHDMFDRSSDRSVMRRFFAAYMQSKYPEWDESKLTYRKV